MDSTGYVFNSVFVTVGTTEFTSLIDKLCSQEFVDFLLLHSCTKLILQVGHSNIDLKVTETKILDFYFTALRNFSLSSDSLLDVQVYRFKNNLAEDMQRADLIICHAGEYFQFLIFST